MAAVTMVKEFDDMNGGVRSKETIETQSIFIQ